MPLAVSDYKISFNEGSITLVEYVGEDSELIIPERILGIPVKHIGPDCFSNAPKVISITIPDKMTIIDESAFSECKNLESIYARNIEIIGQIKMKLLFKNQVIGTISEISHEGYWNYGVFEKRKIIVTLQLFLMI